MLTSGSKPNTYSSTSRTRRKKWDEMRGAAQGVLFSLASFPDHTQLEESLGMRLLFCGDGKFQTCAIEVGGAVWGVLCSVNLIPRPHPAGESR